MYVCMHIQMYARSSQVNVKFIRFVLGFGNSLLVYFFYYKVFFYICIFFSIFGRYSTALALANYEQHVQSHEFIYK